MHYYVNTAPRDDGTHVVHSEECQFLPNEDKRKALGDFAKCETAMDHAKEHFDTVNGCATCASDCHSD